jgi:hypothetical protein
LRLSVVFALRVGFLFCADFVAFSAPVRAVGLGALAQDFDGFLELLVNYCVISLEI